MALGLMMTMVAATAVGSGCSWAHPGANPYRGEPPAALADFAMDEETRRQLRVLMTAHRYTDVVTITRDGIAGQRQYSDLREMHSGHGQRCHGSVDRSAWPEKHEERGLVYCVGATCVIVPTVCNNVSLVTRKPDEAPLGAADEPIDISPAAGPPAAVTPDVGVAQAPDAGPLDFMAPAGVPAAPDTPAGGGGGGGFPTQPGGGGGGGGFPTQPGGGGGGGGFPTQPGGGGGGGGGGCCDTGPIGPGSPPVVTPTSPVPESPMWAMLLAGFAALAALRSRRV